MGNLVLDDIIRVEVAGFRHSKWTKRSWFRWQPEGTQVRLITYVQGKQNSDRWYSVHDANVISINAELTT